MIQLKEKLSENYGCNLLKLNRTQKQRKLQILMDIHNCYQKIQPFVCAQQVVLLSKILKVRENVAKEDLLAGIISKNSYLKLVTKSKIEFMNAVLRHKNKF